MANLPNHQQSRVNGNGLTGKLNTRELFNNKTHGFWEGILDKPANPVSTTPSDKDNLVVLNSSIGHVQPLTPVNEVERDSTQAEANALAASCTNSVQQIDLFQVGVELLQERLALN